MNAKIRKELRLLLPGFIVVALLTCQPLMFQGGLTTLAVWCTAMAVLCVQPFGREWSCGTMAAYLAQPETRNRLFLRKASVLGASVVIVVGICWACLPLHLLEKLMNYLVFAICSYGGGLWIALHLRNAWTAAGAVIALPVVLGIVSMYLVL